MNSRSPPPTAEGITGELERAAAEDASGRAVFERPTASCTEKTGTVESMVETEGKRLDADGATSETAPEEITAADELTG